MLPIMPKLNVVLKSEYVNTRDFQYSLGKKVKGDDDSAIEEHLLFCNTSPDFENFSILTTSNNEFKVK